MTQLKSQLIRTSAAVFFGACFVAGCSSSSDSGSNESSEQSPIIIDNANATTETIAPDSMVNGVSETNNADTVQSDDATSTDTNSADETNGESVAGGESASGGNGVDQSQGTDNLVVEQTDNTAGDTGAEPDTDDIVVEQTDNVGGDAGAVPDPLVQLFTTTTFDITVPAFMSDALQVSVVWGDQDFIVGWVGDESWSVEAELPVNTENTVLVTFSDDNGATTLGTFEQSFTTGANDADSFQVTADQFDTERWDDNSDGVSNLAERIAGLNTTDATRVLLFSETQDFRHDSTEDALVALEQLAASVGMITDRANDSDSIFTEVNLANYQAVVFVQTSGDVLDDTEQVAFENYIRAGGGYAGIHAASFTEYDWPWYEGLVGAYFDSHPEIQSATQVVEDSSHPSTAHLNLTWTRTDEWYDYRTNPRASVNVLLSLDESTYTGGAMGDDHPSAWFHEYDGGRSWYTGGGHTSESYLEPDFRTHLLGGLRYVSGHDE